MPPKLLNRSPFADGANRPAELRTRPGPAADLFRRFVRTTRGELAYDRDDYIMTSGMKKGGLAEQTIDRMRPICEIACVHGAMRVESPPVKELFIRLGVLFERKLR